MVAEVVERAWRRRVLISKLMMTRSVYGHGAASMMNVTMPIGFLVNATTQKLSVHEEELFSAHNSNGLKQMSAASVKISFEA